MAGDPGKCSLIFLTKGENKIFLAMINANTEFI
jgi:hypothetical protein